VNCSPQIRQPLYVNDILTRSHAHSDSPFAPIFGFSRAVRVGNHISVGGTAPIDADGNTVGVGDVAEQARQCFETISKSLEKVDASLSDVVRTRIMLTDLTDWKAVAEVRGALFRDVLPVDTVVKVSGFINPEWLIEIEVDAIVDV